MFPLVSGAGMPFCSAFMFLRELFLFSPLRKSQAVADRLISGHVNESVTVLKTEGGKPPLFTWIYGISLSCCNMQRDLKVDTE